MHTYFFIFILLIQKIFRNVNRANPIFQIKIKKFFYQEGTKAEQIINEIAIGVICKKNL